MSLTHTLPIGRQKPRASGVAIPRVGLDLTSSVQVNESPPPVLGWLSSQGGPFTQGGSLPV